MDFSSLLQAGVEASKPGAGVLRPGGGVGLLTGLVVDRYWDDRRATDVSTHGIKSCTLYILVYDMAILNASGLSADVVTRCVIYADVLGTSCTICIANVSQQRTG